MKRLMQNTALMSFLVMTASLTAAHKDRPSCREQCSQQQEEIIGTDAGRIDFRFLSYVKFPGAYHKIINIQGDHIELQDGSIWVVAKAESIKGWENSEHLLIVPNQATFSTHQFALVNADLRLAEPISLYNEPSFKDKDHRSYIVDEVDPINTLVTLQDGSRWIVHADDMSHMKKINKNDRIIVGGNASEVEPRSPYILIDTSQKHFVRASALKVSE